MRAVVLAALLTLAWSEPAWACGGFFCTSVPIDQSGERILFVLEDGRVQTHIQIQFEGAAEEFSWVVPVPAIPEIGVGNDDLFLGLLESTPPRFWIGDGGPPSRQGWRDRAQSRVRGYSDEPTPAVTVVDFGVVGPYETVVVEANDGRALVEWLVENGYDVPPESLPIVESYVDEDRYFVGLKLRKDQDVGDLRPIVLDVPSDEACLPIRLTAIAATQDMPILVWVLANEQAVSTNYAEVWLNDLRIYGRWAPDYAKMVGEAIDEAGGRAFLVDYAGSPEPFLWAIGAERYDLDSLRSAGGPRTFMDVLEMQGLTEHPLMPDLLRRFLPLPEELAEQGVTEEQFWACITCTCDWYYKRCCERCFGDEIDRLVVDFDAGAFTDAIRAEIVEPLVRAAEPFTRLSTLTRLYTVLSPAEMTEDPIFVLNPDLPPVPQLRAARRQFVNLGDARLMGSDDYEGMLTPNGLRACYPATRTGGETEMPYAALAIRQSARGPGTLVLDESERIANAFPCESWLDPTGMEYVPGGRFADSPDDPWNGPLEWASSDGGCSVPGGGARGGHLAVLTAIALALAARRRRGR